MGVLYEVNWYLVVSGKSAVTETKENRFVTTKSDKRIYPIEAPVPLIFKKDGCIGMVEIKSLSINNDETEIEFEFIEKFDSENSIGKHYYDMYRSIKSSS